MLHRQAVRDSIRSVGIRIVQPLGERTQRGRILPDFLLVGASRSGTTSLHRALAGHPAVVTPLFHKGVHYFDVQYARGMDWYRGHFPLRVPADVRTRLRGQRPRTFESSGYYVHHPLAPQRIARDLPGVRLLVMVRDPVERAYSAHRHEHLRGFEPEPSFERALDMEEDRLRGEVERMITDPGYTSFSHRHHSYVDRGHYATQIRRLFDLVGRERVHVLDSETFFACPEAEFEKVLHFLELDAWRPKAFEQHNARPRSPMPERVREQLTRHFDCPDAELSALLGRPLAWRT